MTFDARGAIRRRSSSRALLLGLALVVGSLALAAPAQGEPAPGSGGAVEDQAAVVVEAGRGAVLPFARLDLAILVLGGAVLIMAAASAPLLFRPLRRPALFAGAAAARDTLLADAREGAPLRVTT